MATELTLEKLLWQIRFRKLILTEGAELWPEDTLIPTAVRKGIVRYRKALLFLIDEGEIHVCVDADLHRRNWYYAGHGFFVCKVCKELGRSEKRLKRHENVKTGVFGEIIRE